MNPNTPNPNVAAAMAAAAAAAAAANSNIRPIMPQQGGGGSINANNPGGPGAGLSLNQLNQIIGGANPSAINPQALMVQQMMYNQQLQAAAAAAAAAGGVVRPPNLAPQTPQSQTSQQQQQMPQQQQQLHPGPGTNLIPQRPLPPQFAQQPQQQQQQHQPPNQSQQQHHSGSLKRPNEQARNPSSSANISRQPGPAPGPPAKKHKPIERSLPKKIEGYIPEAKLYAKMQSVEKYMDSIVTRKRLELQDALALPMKFKKTLRIYVSNTASHQKSPSGDPNTMDPLAIQPPSWCLKIRGALLDTPEENSPKFSRFVKAILVNIDRDPALYQESNTIEWRKAPGMSEIDVFEIKRNGDADTPCKISILFDHQPEKYDVSTELGEVLSLRSQTRSEIEMAFWQYVKINGLQDPEDKKMINLDERLSKVFRIKNKVQFSQIPDLLNPHLRAREPLVINYEIKVDKLFTACETAFDVEVEMDNSNKSRVKAFVDGPDSNLHKTITVFDEQISSQIESIQVKKLKREFMLAYARDPVNFINKWIASQARDLETILGNTRVNLDEMRRASFYEEPWAREAVFRYLQNRLW